jgi:hypothetical protein
MVTVHVLPCTVAQPVKTTPRLAAPGVAVKVTDWPAAKLAEQIEGHAMPDGALATVPLPDRVTVSVNFEKVAVTVLAAVIVTVQSTPPAPLVEAQPFQPPNPASLSGTAVTVTCVLGGKSWKQT